MSFSYTTTSTFTLAHARQIASKVGADLLLCSRYYGSPIAEQIPNYAEEFALLLKGGYVEQYEFGFKRNDARVISWRYSVDVFGNVTTDESPGKMFTKVDISGASYYNFIWYSSKVNELPTEQWSKFKLSLPIQRGTGSAPTDGFGYWASEKTYSAGGVGLTRKVFKPQ